MNRNSRPWRFWLVLLLLLGGGLWLYNSPALEREAPLISAPEKIFWNLKDPLGVKITDESGIKNYRLYMIAEGNRTLMENITPEKPLQEVNFAIQPPKNAMFGREKLVEFEIESTDTSFWNFLAGNSAKKSITAVIDTKRPLLQIIAHSYKITKGGSALVIFKAQDEFLEHLEISNGKDSFTPQPFYKEGYYASLITWPVGNESFNAKITATDSAGNHAITNVNFYRLNKTYRTSNLQLKDSFIEGKIASLIEEIEERPLVSFGSKVEMFKYINEEVRAQNEAVIAEVGKTPSALVAHEFAPLPFYPLRNGAAVASFGDHRFFHYEGERVSESYHLGLDLASVQNAPILSTNGGRVVFTGFLGIYGNTVVVDHGLGLMTLYAHMSEINVQKGDMIAPQSVLGKTGVTGLALGDHLHFGIIVQGQEVSCVEWMDTKWIKLNITDIIQSAIRLIDGA